MYLAVNGRLLPRTPAAVSTAWISIGTAVSTLSLAAQGGLPALDVGQWAWLLVAG